MDFGVPADAIPVVFLNKGGVIVYYSKHRTGRGTQFFAVMIFLHFT